MTLRIGLPQWQHSHWKRWGIENLADYARYFHCVEGNTTLYAVATDVKLAHLPM